MNSRLQKKANATWRRRQCSKCRAIFTTNESVEASISLLFKNRLGKIGAFQRDELFVSVYESCKHRKSATQDATALTDTVLAKLRPHVQDATISYAKIIEVCTEVLKRFDKSAAVHYQAYHPV